MFVVTGDETGLVKLVDVHNRTYLRYGEQQSRALSVSGLAFVSDEQFITASVSGAVHTFTVHREDSDMSVELGSSFTAGIDCPSGVLRTISKGRSDGRVLIYNSEGSAALVNPVTRDSVTFSVKGPISAACTCNNGALFGGKENDARYYDLTTQQESWAAKNVAQDKLHLRVPVWITSIAFRDGLADQYVGDGKSTVFYTGTAHRHVRMYDMQASHQPVVTFEIGADYRVASILPARGSDSERLLYVADTTGGLFQFDMRTQRRVATLKGAAGSIRHMTLSADGSRLACVGLDRFLRVYDTSNNTLESSVYLKNRLNTCAFVENENEKRQIKDAATASLQAKRAAAKQSAALRAVRRVNNDQDEDVLEQMQDGDSDSDGLEVEDDEDVFQGSEGSEADEEEDEGDDNYDEEEDEGEEGNEDDEDDEEDEGEEDGEEPDEDDDEISDSSESDALPAKSKRTMAPQVTKLSSAAGQAKRSRR